MYVFCLPCFRVCSLLPCGHLKGRADLLTLVCDVNCNLVTFPFGILGQVWYLIVSIPGPCSLSYFNKFLCDEFWRACYDFTSFFFISIKHIFYYHFLRKLSYS